MQHVVKVFLVLRRGLDWDDLVDDLEHEVGDGEGPDADEDDAGRLWGRVDFSCEISRKKKNIRKMTQSSI